MQGKILIVDAIATNRIVLKVKLRTAYYEVVQADNLIDAERLARCEHPDLIISALSLPDGTVSDLCRALEQYSPTAHIPVLGIGHQPDSKDRMTALQSGAWDVLSCPVDTTLLLGRVRSLIRAHNTDAEWHLRDDASLSVGLAEAAAEFEGQAHCVLISAETKVLQTYAMQLRPSLQAKLSLALNTDPTRPADVFVLVVGQDTAQARETLNMVVTLRANASTRHSGILVLQTVVDPEFGAHALDLGADDLMTHGFDACELALRIKALLRRKRMAEHRRATVRNGLQEAATDPLTGLHNRRYAMPHLEQTARDAHRTKKPFAVLAADLDHFKKVNDLYGHASGDAVLVEVAKRLRHALRESDMVARIGGEEFLIVMPGTPLAEARAAALRLCAEISAKAFHIPGSAVPIAVTISIGMILADGAEPAATSMCTSDGLLDGADRALYAAKGHGRNQVMLGRPAA